MRRKMDHAFLFLTLKMAAEVTIVLYTLVFGFYSFLEVSGSLPQEIRSAGLTLTSLFSRYYGDQVYGRESELNPIFLL